MTSLTKSKVIEYYREYPDNCICMIGDCQSDIDSIISSDIGINLQSPKNRNTILSHFYSPDSNLLIIKKIIKVGRTVKENNSLMKISISIYTLIINSYILCCFIREMDVIQGQLNFLEIAFLILSITAFSSNVDNNECSNNFNKKRSLYICYNITLIGGLIVIKAIAIYYHSYFYESNDFIVLKEKDKIFITFYFIFCIEQLFSTIMIINSLSFYRESWLFNTWFIIFSLLLFFYFVITICLTNTNYNEDIFDFLNFEFFENLVDAVDENNKLSTAMVCITDFIISMIYSIVINFIFIRLSK